MEYIFGQSTRRRKDITCLKTKGSEHTSLSGHLTHIDEYQDSKITHDCDIADHYKSAEDTEGNCYDWYLVEHYDCKIELSEIERQALNDEIDELTQYCGDMVDELYQSDIEYIIGEEVTDV